MTVIGYFEGTDSLLLAKLAAEGIETIPVANFSDSHGKYVSYLNKGEVSVVVGHLHKVIPAEQERTAMFSLMLDNLLSTAKIHGIPFLLIVPSSHIDKAKKLLGERPNVHIVAPDDLESQIRKYL
jgi:hypothetical protein